MSLITTNDGRTIIKKASSMMVVPYVYDSTIGDYVLGSDVYDISAIIGDTITLEQSDGNTEAKYNEFKASPLIESVSGSKYNFTAQCLDLQNSVLRSLFGAMTAGSNEGAAAFNDDFVRLYALIRIRFSDQSIPDIILPKVQMNSKLFIQQLKTRASQGNISGTAFAKACAIQNSSNTALLLFSSIASDNIYTPYTPVLFVPKNRVPIFYYKKNTDTLDYYTYINFSNGSVSNDVVVKPSDGSLPTPGGGGGGEGGGGGDDD
jgi:hypothetical protein